MALRPTVEELRKGDHCFIEDNLGQLRLAQVTSISKYHVSLEGQRFYRPSGWELQYKRSAWTTGAQPHKDRIHLGDGKLFTQEDADRRTARQREQLKREALIYSITHLTSSQLRKLSTEILSQIVSLTMEDLP